MSRIGENIAFNLKRVRKARHMSLDMMAERTGVSKSMLGQIERGESNPTVSTIGRIVEGIGIPFEELLYRQEEGEAVTKIEAPPVYREKEGAYRFQTLFPYDRKRKLEIIRGEMESGAFCEDTARPEGVTEYITVIRGRMILEMDGRQYELGEGQALRFCAARAHSYRNPGGGRDCFQMVLLYETPDGL